MNYHSDRIRGRRDQILRLPESKTDIRRRPADESLLEHPEFDAETTIEAFERRRCPRPSVEY